MSARPTATGLVLDRPKPPSASLQAPEPPVSAAGPAQPRARRDEIQALRAVAVTLVVLYHAWPSAVPGGYVGVDVFFVVSGFLITTLLVREIERTGTVSLPRFWARRARRILPAALLTLLVCALATIAFLPVTEWEQAFDELRASAAYVQNLHLAAASVDYAAAGDGPSIVQHFWTLSIEEQFYLAWPIVLLVAAAIARGRRPLAVAMAVLTGASLVYALVETAADPDAAYFLTPARAWEFGVGGLLALFAPPRRTMVAVVASWLGLTAILTAALVFSDATPFPGTAALLPVLGTVAIIWAGTPDGPATLTPLVRLRPVQRLGDVSYAAYLWHWPLLVLAPFAVGGGVAVTAGVVALTVALAALTKRLVEDPVRFSTALTGRRTAWTLGLALAATGAVLAVAVAGGAYVDHRIREDQKAAESTLEAQPPCFGALAFKASCADAPRETTVAPTPLAAERIGNAPCEIVERQGRVHVCAFGVPRDDARATTALIGDSHASHWRPAMEVVADRERWHGLSVTRSGCPFSAALPDGSPRAQANCERWNREVPQWLARHDEIETVFVAAHAGGRVVGAAPRRQFAAQRDGFTTAWRSLPDSVERVVVLRDTPTMRAATLTCVQTAIDEGARPASRCAVPRARALDADPAVAAAERWSAPRPRVDVVDLTDLMCGRRVCRPVIGGALVYRDEDHLTAPFAATLGPFLHRDVERILE